MEVINWESRLHGEGGVTTMALTTPAPTAKPWHFICQVLAALGALDTCQTRLRTAEEPPWVDEVMHGMRARLAIEMGGVTRSRPIELRMLRVRARDHARVYE